MSYNEMARLDVLSAIQGIETEAEYLEFRDFLARYFADKAQKAIDAMWDRGEITKDTIEEWGNTKMRTPYRYALHRS